MVCIKLQLAELELLIISLAGIVIKLTSILTYSYENNVDQFFEPLLGIHP